MSHLLCPPHLAENAENNRGYYYALASVTLLCYIASLTGITLLYIYFTTVSNSSPSPPAPLILSISLSLPLLSPPAAASTSSSSPWIRYSACLSASYPSCPTCRSVCPILVSCRVHWSHCIPSTWPGPLWPIILVGLPGGISNGNMSKHFPLPSQRRPAILACLDKIWLVWAMAPLPWHHPHTTPRSLSIPPTSLAWLSGCSASSTIASALPSRCPRSTTITARNEVRGR